MGKERLESKAKINKKKVECPIIIGLGNDWQGRLRATGSRWPREILSF